MRSFLAGLTTLGAVLLLSACGGGGAGGNPNQGGPISISPATGTFYAGVPSRITLSGGRRPYALTSSEPGILPVPPIVDGHTVDVIPNNPGVVDVGQQPGQLPSRTVTISARDSTGILVNAILNVGQNFLTGYGLNLSPVTCPAPLTGTAPQACSGGTTAARMQATFNGSLTGNRLFRYRVIRGNFTVCDAPPGPCGESVLLRSDHTGSVLGFIVVPPNTPTQLAVIRVIDEVTGVYADTVFTISSSAANQGRLTTIPSAITFTGPMAGICGTGSADILVFDGLPPYTAISTSPNIIVTNSPSNTQPGRITIQAINPSSCVDASVIITDSTGARTTVQVITAPGTTTPPAPTPVVAAPDTITLACGQTGSVSVVGGSGGYQVNSSSPDVIATVGGNTISITRVAPGGAAAGNVTSTVSVTDGSTIDTVAVTAPGTC